MTFKEWALPTLGGGVGLFLLLTAVTEGNNTVVLVGELLWLLAAAMFWLAAWRAERKP